MSADRDLGQTVASLLTIGAAMFSLGAVVDDPVLSVASTLAATAAVAVGLSGRWQFKWNPAFVGGLSSLVVLVAANTQRMARFSIDSGTYRIHFALGMATAILLMVSTRWAIRPLVIVCAITAVLVGALTVLIPNWRPELSSDVYRAHTAAGRAVSNGLNPYSDAVTFESGDPSKPDGTIVEGYPYPTVPLLSYGLASSFTDPRVVSLIAWFAFACGLGLIAMRTGVTSDLAIAGLAVVATLPVWRMTVFMAWTEPMSIALFGLAFAGLARHKLWGWLVLGVALSSKQYLVFLLPVVLMYRDENGRRPGWKALVAAGAITLAPVVFGPFQYIRSIVGNALDIGFRPDTQSLNGAIGALGGDFQIPIGISFALIAIIWLGTWRHRIPARHLPAVGVAVLSVLFLTTSAFPNYWMFVVGLSVLAALSATSEGHSSRLGENGSRDKDRGTLHAKLTIRSVSGPST